MSYYRKRYHKRYNYKKYRYMKNRKHKTFNKRDRPQVVVGVVVFICIALYGIGANGEMIVGLLSLGLLLSAIVYAFYVLLSPFIRDIRSLSRLYSRKAGRDIDTMSGVEFEKYIAQVLKSRGCVDVSLTEQYDLGVDIIVKKDGVTWGIQTKRWNNQVGIDAVRQAVAALKEYDCDRAMVITNSRYGYSAPARELARSNNCILVDRKVLIKWTEEYDTSTRIKTRPLAISQQ